VVFHLPDRHQFVHQVREPLRRRFQFLLKPVLPVQLRQHQGAVAAPVRQNQVAEAVVLGHGLIVELLALSQPVREHHL
jgi:hypothetical protein